MVFWQTLSPTGWWFGTFLFFHILGIIIPTDELIFFKGVEITNQPTIIPNPMIWCLVLIDGHLATHISAHGHDIPSLLIVGYRTIGLLWSVICLFSINLNYRRYGLWKSGKSVVYLMANMWETISFLVLFGPQIWALDPGRSPKFCIFAYQIWRKVHDMILREEKKDHRVVGWQDEAMEEAMEKEDSEIRFLWYAFCAELCKELAEFIWLCLKMGYTPNYSHLVGIMISKTIGCRGTLFSDKPMFLLGWMSIHGGYT